MPRGRAKHLRLVAGRIYNLLKKEAAYGSNTQHLEDFRAAQNLERSLDRRPYDGPTTRSRFAPPRSQDAGTTAYLSRQDQRHRTQVRPYRGPQRRRRSREPDCRLQPSHPDIPATKSAARDQPLERSASCPAPPNQCGNYSSTAFSHSQGQKATSRCQPVGSAYRRKADIDLGPCA
jgi:hypothetical protein